MQLVMGYGIEKLPGLPAFANISAFFSKPGLGVLLAEPVLVIHGEDTLH